MLFYMVQQHMSFNTIDFVTEYRLALSDILPVLKFSINYFVKKRCGDYPVW